MPKLSDTQAILLTHAAQNDTASLYPLPQTLRRGGGITKAIGALVSAGYADEREAGDGSAVHRTDADVRYGIYATAAGLAAIGIVDGEQGAAQPSPDPATAASTLAMPRVTKASTVVALLSQPTGATLPELITATGWLPHTTRAALTGLRKKGHTIVRYSRDGATCYRIDAAAAAA
ncbi:DUF3489 domain-containing protein [Microvirga sp. SRT01]|uniref:DUF3489 domain-containing protein n=1 Tax=Sphingomonas longa TaxID=2778730 RepID=A0ABS2D9Y6_9SPHN|nr:MULTISPECIES: DUF3489 domain-containing protein [Alphaproteobacteria]MBM6577759.1 DUF3489 domain-containing protein [Sphingomonas sp. BT552]MBR7710801.1 DUF3489 domain-containing protein [Microvirga sp. SRT01]